MHYNIIDYSHLAIHYIPTTYLFDNWKLVPLDPLHPFHRPLNSFPSSNQQFALCMYECGFFFGLFFVLKTLSSCGEKLDHSVIAGRNVKWYRHSGKELDSFLKIN